MSYTISLVEDEEVLRENFSDLLQSEGFDVDTFSDASSALDHFNKKLPDLALLDISLGSDSEAGFHLCSELRRLSDTIPIIFFTSHASDVDKISGMRLGADDYLTKDITFEYLIVRIKALLRRIQAISAAPGEPSKVVKSGDLAIDLDCMTVAWKDQKVPMNLTQVYILTCLVNNSGTVQTSEQLMEAARIRVEPNTIAAHIKNIRSAFKDVDPDFSCIHTERSLGYRWLP